jgi:hypothetical protein
VPFASNRHEQAIEGGTNEYCMYIVMTHKKFKITSGFRNNIETITGLLSRSDAGFVNPQNVLVTLDLPQEHLPSILLLNCKAHQLRTLFFFFAKPAMRAHFKTFMGAGMQSFVDHATMCNFFNACMAPMIVRWLLYTVL